MAVTFVIFLGFFLVAPILAYTANFEEVKTKICKNGGVFKNTLTKDECACIGTGFYGSECEIPCHKDYNINNTCFFEDCKDIPYECLDTRYPIIINHKHIDRKIYPLCEETHRVCMDTSDNFFVNRTLQIGCLYGGLREQHTVDSNCWCRGSGRFGKYCERDCNELGTTIPEVCLTEKKCDLPTSCVDLSRPGIFIDRCKNKGFFVQDKQNGRCSCFGTGYFGLECEQKCPLKCSKDCPPECINF